MLPMRWPTRNVITRLVADAQVVTMGDWSELPGLERLIPSHGDVIEGPRSSRDFERFKLGTDKAAHLHSSDQVEVQAGASTAKDYAPLMERLHAIDAAGYHLGALEWQNELWDAYSHHRYGFALGISAFPSMHNAISFLYVLAAWKARPWLRILTWTFASIILIGSVHLGWHYIADGLVAWPAMAVIWWGSGLYRRKCGYDEAVEEKDYEPSRPAAAIPAADEKPELLAA